MVVADLRQLNGLDSRKAEFADISQVSPDRPARAWLPTRLAIGIVGFHQ
jgi:hypothetical protein